jgi:hypothetical protein
MRKLFIVGVLSLFVAALMPSLAQATHSNGQGPDKDFIAGAAKGTLPTGPCGNQPAHFHTNGMSTAVSGVPAQGQFFTDLFITCPVPVPTLISFSGTVDCVNASTGIFGPGVDGNGATWMGTITQTSFSFPGLLGLGYRVLSRHVDNGEGQGDPPDRALGITLPPSFPTSCGQKFATNPITSGNLVVHDGI